MEEDEGDVIMGVDLSKIPALTGDKLDELVSRITQQMITARFFLARDFYFLLLLASRLRLRVKVSREWFFF